MADYCQRLPRELSEVLGVGEHGADTGEIEEIEGGIPQDREDGGTCVARTWLASWRSSPSFWRRARFSVVQ